MPSYSPHGLTPDSAGSPGGYTFEDPDVSSPPAEPLRFELLFAEWRDGHIYDLYAYYSVEQFEEHVGKIGGKAYLRWFADHSFAAVEFKQVGLGPFERAERESLPLFEGYARGSRTLEPCTVFGRELDSNGSLVGGQAVPLSELLPFLLAGCNPKCECSAWDRSSGRHGRHCPARFSKED